MKMFTLEEFDECAVAGISFLILVILMPLICSYYGAKLLCAVIGWLGFTLYDRVEKARDKWGSK